MGHEHVLADYRGALEAGKPGALCRVHQPRVDEVERTPGRIARRPDGDGTGKTPSLHQPQARRPGRGAQRLDQASGLGLRQSAFGYRLKLARLQGDRTGIVGEARMGDPIVHHFHHREHAGGTLARRLGIGDHSQAAALALVSPSGERVGGAG
jgi:hypothetical protein